MRNIPHQKKLHFKQKQGKGIFARKQENETSELPETSFCNKNVLSKNENLQSY